MLNYSLHSLFKIIIKNKFYLSFIFIILFTVLYRFVHYIENYKLHNWMDYFHFSLITQTTVGYGFNNEWPLYETKINSTSNNKLFQVINILQLCSILYCYLQ